MPATPEQDAWLQRVIGLSLDARVDAPATRPAGFNGRIIWRDAKETADAKLDALAQALRGFADPDLDRIAEFGLFGLGTRQNVTLAKALTEYETAPPKAIPAAARALRGAVANYRTLLQGDGIVKLIDEVPLPEAPALRATLGAALDSIEGAMG